MMNYGPAELFIEYLDTVFGNISCGDATSWEGQRLKPLAEVESMADAIEAFT